MRRPFLAIPLVPALLAISSLGASGAAPSGRSDVGRHRASGSACTPLVNVGEGRETCYLPSQIQEAQTQFPLPPLDPSPAVQSLAGLQLVQILRYQQTSQPRTTRFLLYIYGTLPPIGDRAFSGAAPFPPPRAHPRYMIVEEALGHDPSLTGLFLGRPIQFAPDGKTPTSYGAWHLDANFSHRDLQLMIVSDATKALTRAVGKAIIAIDARGPVVPSPFVRLSLSVPASTYPRNALVRVTVRLRNISSHAIHLTPGGCPIGKIGVDILDAAGRIVYPPILPGGPSPKCGVGSGPGRAVAPGQTLSTPVVVVMRGWRLQAQADTVEAGTVLGTPRWIRLTRSDAPAVAIQTRPELHADLTRPAGATGPLWYFAWSQCHSGTGQSMTGMFGWSSTAGARLDAAQPSSCTGAPEWHALVGWLGHSVAHIDHTGA